MATALPCRPRLPCHHVSHTGLKATANTGRLMRDDVRTQKMSWRRVLSCPVLSLLHFLSCVVLSLSLLVISACLCPGSYVRFRPRPFPSTCRWARLATHRHKEPHSASSVLSCPLWQCNHRMCVIAVRLGSLQWLAHAEGHG